MKQYLDLVNRVLEEGNDKSDRTGTGTRSVFGGLMCFDMQDGFPLMTHKKMYVKSIFAELVWFLSGSTVVEDLRKLGSTIWDEWEDKETGTIGPMYGASWRGREPYTVDQYAKVIYDILNDPDSRRILVSVWNPELLPLFNIPPNENPRRGRMALGTCHPLFQFYVEGDTLHMNRYQRSQDLMIGYPYNLASYAALLHITAELTGKKPGKLIEYFGDIHIYKNHMSSGGVEEVLSRTLHDLPRFDTEDYFTHYRDLFVQLSKDNKPLEDYCCLLDQIFEIKAKETLQVLVNAVKGYTSGKTIKFDINV